jgi:hypothetical protein
MRQTRHKSTEVALGYRRPADLLRNNVIERVFQREGPADVDDALPVGGTSRAEIVVTGSVPRLSA